MTGIRELYNLMEGYILTPTELLANAKLPNYEYVKFSNNGQGLHAESCCKLEEGERVIFNYYFDEKDRLQKLIMEDGKKQEVLFDRMTEIENLKSKLIKKRDTVRK
ncbi:hypothetical protein ABEO75_14800 [Paenibacillus macerans]|uniref:Uncharacterized protein n=1 Tax=Paenibacillus oralis TaxID=2490856 RepID=A0A3P3U1K3_9BACL|nr:MULTISPECIES: hypothetical protein [Paenibacillus]MED4954457.1 hypothetical protein [Paenibacillus macerans]RRJ63980.1 hypothetical protein EHV15_14350 [Paenibacillus oralis]